MLTRLLKVSSISSSSCRVNRLF